MSVHPREGEPIWILGLDELNDSALLPLIHQKKDFLLPHGSIPIALPTEVAGLPEPVLLTDRGAFVVHNRLRHESEFYPTIKDFRTIDWDSPDANNYAQQAVDLFLEPSVFQHLYRPPTTVQTLRTFCEKDPHSYRNAYISLDGNGDVSATVLTSDDKGYETRTTWLHLLAVRQDVRHQGVGTITIEQVLARAFTTAKQNGQLRFTLRTGTFVGINELNEQEIFNIFNRVGIMPIGTIKGAVTLPGLENLQPYMNGDWAKAYNRFVTELRKKYGFVKAEIFLEQMTRDVVDSQITRIQWAKILLNDGYKSISAIPITEYLDTHEAQPVPEE